MQPTPVPDHEPDSNREPDSDHEPDRSHEVAEPTCLSVDSELRELAQPSVNSTVDLKEDIGYFHDETKSAGEIAQVIQSMSDGQRYHLLKHHAQLSQSYKFPTQYLGGAN